MDGQRSASAALEALEANSSDDGWEMVVAVVGMSHQLVGLNRIARLLIVVVV